MLYTCKELNEAREDWRVFCVSRHVDPGDPTACKRCTRLLGDGQGTIPCQAHADCRRCSPPELFAGTGFENWPIANGYRFTADQCQLLQRAKNALYNVGSPRLALHYWTKARIPIEGMKPGVRMSRLAAYGRVSAIMWFSRARARGSISGSFSNPFKIFDDAKLEMSRAAISYNSDVRPNRLFQDRRATLIACAAYLNLCPADLVVAFFPHYIVKNVHSVKWCDQHALRMVAEFAPAMLSDASHVSNLICAMHFDIVTEFRRETLVMQVNALSYLLRRAPVPGMEVLFADAACSRFLSHTPQAGFTCGDLQADVAALLRIFVRVDKDNRKEEDASGHRFQLTRVFETPAFYRLNQRIFELVCSLEVAQKNFIPWAEFLSWLQTPRIARFSRAAIANAADMLRWVQSPNLDFMDMHDFIPYYMAYIVCAFSSKEDDASKEPEQKRNKTNE